MAHYLQNNSNDNGFLIRNQRSEEAVQHFSSARIANLKFYIHWKYPLGMKGKLRYSQMKKQLSESVPSRTTLKDWLQEVLKIESKW